MACRLPTHFAKVCRIAAGQFLQILWQAPINNPTTVVGGAEIVRSHHRGMEDGCLRPYQGISSKLSRTWWKIVVSKWTDC